jgi:hypothetical protein
MASGNDDAPALRADGTLKDADEIEWQHSATEDLPDVSKPLKKTQKKSKLHFRV